MSGARPATLTIATRNNGGDVVISVRDEGIGVAREDLSRIFDRLERRETGIAGRIAGAGLGLSIVQEIAILRGGRLWADSELGLGSTFHLAIPANHPITPSPHHPRNLHLSADSRPDPAPASRRQ